MATTATQTAFTPLDLTKWLSENADRLQPPVNNHCLYSGDDFTLMILGGPNTRNDFHVNETEEWFFQLKGDMMLRVIQNDQVRDISIKQGEMFLLPANTPHNPVRYANTQGLVMERRRPANSIDRLRWYCEKGDHSSPTLIREVSFHCTDLGVQLIDPINQWRTNELYRKCPECGQIADPQ